MTGEKRKNETGKTAVVNAGVIHLGYAYSIPTCKINIKTLKYLSIILEFQRNMSKYFLK